MLTKTLRAFIRTGLAVALFAVVLTNGACDQGSQENGVGQAGKNSQSRPAEFYVPAGADSIHFHPADPTHEQPWARGASMGYSLPAGTSFPSWLAGLKHHLRLLGYYRLSRAYFPTPVLVGDAAGWREQISNVPHEPSWMWQEAWVNPTKGSAISVFIGTDERPIGQKGLLLKGGTVGINHESGAFVKEILAEYAKHFDVPWTATQSAPDDGAGVQTKAATNAE